MAKQKIDRQSVYQKYDGHCAYCGKEITLKQMQVDHIIPLYRKYPNHEIEQYGKKRGTHNLDNLNPSCARCNRWKSDFTLEQFRNEISLQVERLRRDSSAFRMAEDFGLIKSMWGSKVVFHFEYIEEYSKILVNTNNNK